MRLPTPVQMETICCIARTRTFTGAAATLRTTQSAVSARVHEVEEMLAVELFRRNGRTVELTLAGKRFVETIEPILNNLRSFMISFQDPESASGRIRIGASSGGTAAATRMICDLQTRAPGLTFDLVSLPTVEMLSQLTLGRLDLVVFAVPVHSLDDSEYVYRSLGHEQMLWLMAAALAQEAVDKNWSTRDKLANLSVWSAPKPTSHYEWSVGALLQRDFTIPRPCTSTHMPALIQIATEGGGIALLTESSTRELRNSGKLVAAFDDVEGPTLEFFIVSQKERHTALLQRIMDIAVATSRFQALAG